MRKLKVLDRLFYRPLLEEGSHMPREMVERLFPNLQEVLAWHDKYNKMMKARVKDDGLPVNRVADILKDMVSAKLRAISRIKLHAPNQSLALELLAAGR